MTTKEKLNEQLKQLVELQKLDSKRLRLQREKDEFPQILKDISISFEKVTKQFDAADKKMEHESGIKRQLERELQLETDKIQKKKDRATELKTNKEYETHLHEIEMAKEHISEIEEKILESFERIDKVEAKLKIQKANRSASKKELAAKKTEISNRINTIDKEMADFDDVYAKIVVLVEKKLLAEYNRTKKGSRGLGLVEVTNNICGGCHLNLMPQFAAEVKKQDKIYTCPHCFRLLYYQEPAKEEEKVTNK